MHYEVVGNADGPTLMLMHGFMSSKLQWERNIDRLGAELRLVLVELMGHGSSPVPDDVVHYERAAVLARLEAIREAVGVDRWFVGGHSLGGAVSIRYAMAHPDRTRGVVFTNTRAAFGNEAGRDQAVANVSAAGVDLRSLPYHPIGAKHFPPDLKARMVAIADQMAPIAVLNTVANRVGWSSIDELHSLVPPALLINGRFERAFQPFVPTAQAALATLEVVHLDGGHSVNVEQPEGYNAAVLDFVARHQAG